jgi:hypothetical protein
VKPSLPVKPQPPVINGNGTHPAPERDAWRLEHERRRAELRLIYAGLPDLVVDDMEREAMKETERLPRAGALALVVYVRRRRRKALEPAKA